MNREFLIWNHILQAGEEFGLEATGMGGVYVRRIEAGIMINGTDLDPGMNPFQAGLGKFVNMDKDHFIGKAALETAKRKQLLWGISCDAAIPELYAQVTYEGEVVGRVTSSAWSPLLNQGIGYVRFFSANDWEGEKIMTLGRNGNVREATVVQLPFYDPEKKISRGLDATIPEKP